jgi:hypothetical protein
MKDTLTGENSADFKQRYANTYGFLHTDDKKRFVHLTEVNRDYVYFSEGNKESTFNVKADSGVFFEFIPVNKGWYLNRLNKLVYLQRVPTRQWSRGICPNNTQMYEDTAVGPVNVSLLYKRLADIFNQDDHYRIKDVKVPGFALSKHFAISKSGALYFYLQNVGTYVYPKIVLNVPEIRQELEDVIRRRGLNLTVEVL